MNSALPEQFKALGDPIRMKILGMLPTTPKCSDVYNVSELAEELKIPQPTVSHHLKVLFQAELIKKEKMCRDAYYWIDQKAFNKPILKLKSLINSSS